MILNLGLESRPGTVHFPVIRTQLRQGPDIEEALSLSKKATHLLLTSPRATHYWAKLCPPPWKTQVWAIGSATYRQADRFAQVATQEGMMALFEGWTGGLVLLPHSARARPHLRLFLQENSIAHAACALYDTLLQCPGEPPNLAEFTEILFTSPSTVDGFLAIYGALPQGIQLTPIGPVTRTALEIRK